MKIAIATLLFVSLSGVASASAQNHGAIAYDAKSHHWGWAVKRPSAEAAKKAALGYCNQNAGSGCEVKLEFANDCGAYARGKNHAGGWGKAKTKDEASSIAVAFCKSHGGDNCKLEVWACAESPMEELFGALAYDMATHHYGWAVNYPTQKAADAAARNGCGTGCKVREKFFGTCAAYATNAAHHFGWAKKATRREAELAAVEACGKEAAGCAVKVWGCSDRQ